jgi:fructokinase
MTKIYGGIEAGGTKFVCAIGSEPSKILAETRFPTTTPEETLGKALSFFQEFRNKGGLDAIGIASFGPVDLDPNSNTYGFITKTPKPNWSNTDIVNVFNNELDIPVGFDTDVNGALLGEYRWGASQGLANSIYLTIGTGIGGGAMVNGKLVHGLVHPEMGHVMIPPRSDDPYPYGHCLFHGNCLEGMASGPAMEAKWGIRAENLSPDHPAWDLEAHYLAIALHGFICTLSPQRIILGGGVMNQTQLFPLVRQKTVESLRNYVQHPILLEKIDEYIVPPGLGSYAGVLGAIALAQDAITIR